MGLALRLWGRLELQFCHSTGLRSKTAPIPCKIYAYTIITEHRLNHVRGTLDPNTITGNPQQQESLREVKQNMKSVDAQMQRNNTTNRIYGYNYVMGNKPFSSETLNNKSVGSASKKQLAAGVGSIQSTNRHIRGVSLEPAQNSVNQSEIIGGGSILNRDDQNNNNNYQNFEMNRKGRGGLSSQIQRNYNIVSNRIF